MDSVPSIVRAFRFLPWIIMKLITYLYRIKSTECVLANDSKRPIENFKVDLPGGTKFATLRGTYWLKPFMGTFTVFIRRDHRYWVQQADIVFNDDKTWEAKVTFDEGKPGVYYAILADVCPELDVLVRYYWKVGKECNKWVGIEMPPNLRGISGLRKIHREITVTIE